MTGISRSVFTWYWAKRGAAEVICRHDSSRSGPCSSSAVTAVVRPAVSMRTLSGWAAKLWYQAGFLAAPAADATSSGAVRLSAGSGTSHPRRPPSRWPAGRGRARPRRGPWPPPGVGGELERLHAMRLQTQSGQILATSAKLAGVPSKVRREQAGRPVSHAQLRRRWVERGNDDVRFIHSRRTTGAGHIGQRIQPSPCVLGAQRHHRVTRHPTTRAISCSTSSLQPAAASAPDAPHRPPPMTTASIHAAAHHPRPEAPTVPPHTWAPFLTQVRRPVT